MKIRYLGHSCFLFADGAGTRIVTDPYGDVGFCMPRVQADGVTVSHAHFDHCNVSTVEGNPAVFNKADRFGLGGVQISATESFHDDAKGKKRGSNLIFHYQMDGLHLCHLGDLGEKCSSSLVNAIGSVDVLLIPVGGNYTIDAMQAKEYIDRIRPAVVIPMHYKTDGLDINIGGLDEFLRLFDRDVAIEYRGSEISLLPENLKANTTKIIVMERERA